MQLWQLLLCRSMCCNITCQLISGSFYMVQESLRMKLCACQSSAGLCKVVNRSLFVQNICIIAKILLSFLAFLWSKGGWKKHGILKVISVELVGRNCTMTVVIYLPLLFLCFSSLKWWLLMLLSLQNHSSTWISSTWISIKSSRNRKHL